MSKRKIRGLTGWARYHDLEDYQNGVTDLIMIEFCPPENDIFNQEVQVDVCIREEQPDEAK